MGPTHRAVTRAYIGLVVGVVIFFALIVWPGYITSYSCAWSIDPTTSVNGHTYCYEFVQLPVLPWSSYHHYQAWGFEFTIEQTPNPAGPALNIWVSESSGATYFGSVNVIGPTNGTEEGSWFTIDGAAGISVLWETGNVTLYVEK